MREPLFHLAKVDGNRKITENDWGHLFEQTYYTALTLYIRGKASGVSDDALITHSRSLAENKMVSIW